MEGLVRRLERKLNEVKLPSVKRLSQTKLAVFWAAVLLLIAGVIVWVSLGHTFPIIQSRGEIANQQRDLLVFATGLALLVLLPVYCMIFVFAWRYRAGHKRAYRPEWDSHKGYEALWWGIPVVIISVLAVVTWKTSHSLDPFRPLASSQPPVKVQVIALQWKWLFLYPEEGVASVNELAFPVDRPVELTLTSDAPMNSFWVPQLAGQIYAMSGMSTKLHLSADAVGEYRGMSSNISGKGFADMQFRARALPSQQYPQWLAEARAAGTGLSLDAYRTLAKPGASGPQLFASVDPTLYDAVIMKYMSHQTTFSTNEVKLSDEKSASQVKSESGDEESHGGHH